MVDGEAVPVTGAAGASGVLADELDEAFTFLREGVERLLLIGDRGDLCALGPAGLIEVAQRFEAHRASLLAVDTAIVEAAVEERLEEFTCSRSLAIALADALRISRASANARVARARQLMPQNGFSAGSNEAKLPVLAGAVRAGSITGDQAQVICGAMGTLGSNPQLGRALLAQAEQVLVTDAGVLGPDQLRAVAARIDEVLLPDGMLAREAVAGARRALSVGPERRDGTHPISGSLTRTAYVRLMSVLSPLAAPRPAEDALGRDPRSAPQRLHDALEDAMARLLDSPGLPRSGGTPATVHVSVDADRLRAAVIATAGIRHDPDPTIPSRATRSSTHGGGYVGAGQAVATTSFGGRLTFGELVQLAEQARIIPTYLSSTRGIVAYGAQRRCASEGQTHALIARDHGCSFPGCDAPAEWCQRHHVIAWWRGGPTDLDNLTLVCSYHHREFEHRGWQVVIYHGLPVWIPPSWLDRNRTPRINARIRAAHPCAIDLDRLDAHTVLAQARATENAITATTALPATSPTDGDGPLEDLDPIPDLTDLLAQHIDPEEREEFHYDLDLVLDSYLGPHAPTTRRLQPAA